MSIFTQLTSRFFKKAIDKAVNQQLRQAMRSAQSKSRSAGLMDRHQINAIEGQIPESPHDELLERYAVQPGLRAPVDKVAKIICACKYELGLKKGYDEVAWQRQYLEALIANPYTRTSFSTLVFETVVRLKVLGECFWELIYPTDDSLNAQLMPMAKMLFQTALHNEAKVSPSVNEARIAELQQICIKAAVRAIEQRKRLPVGMRILQGTVNPILDRHGDFVDPNEAFVQIVASGEREYFKLEDVLWMRGPNPLGGAHALPPFESLRFMDDIDQKTQVYQNSILDNRGELGGTITVKNPAPGELDRIRQEIETQFKGPENAGQWYVIGVEGDGDTKVQPFQIEPLKLEPEEAAMRRLRLFWSVLNVPGGKVGFINDVNRANIEMQDKALLEEEIYPLCGIVVDGFDQLLQMIDMEGYCLKFSQADLRTETDKLKVRRSRFELGYLTVNELLTEELGPDATVMGGDIRIINFAEGAVIFSKDREPHVITAAGVAMPLYADTSNPGFETGVPPGYANPNSKNGNGQVKTNPSGAASNNQ